MESHKGIPVCIVVFALDIAVVHVIRHRIVDIQKCYRILAHAGSDKLAQRAVNIYFAGYRDTHTSQTAVDIAGNETKLCLECRPAFACNGNVFAVASVLFDPIKQRKLILCQFR